MLIKVEYDINIIIALVYNIAWCYKIVNHQGMGKCIHSKTKVTLILDIMNIFPHGSKPSQVNNQR